MAGNTVPAPVPPDTVLSLLTFIATEVRNGGPLAAALDGLADAEAARTSAVEAYTCEPDPAYDAALRRRDTCLQNTVDLLPLGVEAIR